MHWTETFPGEFPARWVPEWLERQLQRIAEGQIAEATSAICGQEWKSGVDLNGMPPDVQEDVTQSVRAACVALRKETPDVAAAEDALKRARSMIFA